MINQITVYPSQVRGHISAPPSKSETHRAIICASLACGTSMIENVILSEDIKATILAVEALGAKTSYHNKTLRVHSNGKLPSKCTSLDCNESGSTLRFMIPLFSLENQKTVFRGATSLMNRPLTIYEDIFNQDGFHFNKDGNTLTIKACLKARNYDIPGNISSQFISGLLFALPLRNSDSHIRIIGDFESKNYVLLTLKVLKSFGIHIEETSDGYTIKGGQTYTSQDYKISGDYSQAAYFLVAGAFSNSLSVINLDKDSLQGDKAIIDILKRAKAHISSIDDGYQSSNSSLIATNINIENCPDLGPVIALMCSLSKGKSVITGASRLRIKESDRIQSTVSVLSALGAHIYTVGDDIHIHGVERLRGGGVVDSFNDHRIAMMASIACLVSEKPITITHPLAINKSYPNFYEDLESIGVKIKRGETIEDIASSY